MAGRARGLVPRLLLLAAVAGGLYYWSDRRRPRDLALEIDLTAALPGDVAEVDVIVRRAGHALARHDVSYGAAGAPGTVQFVVHASPGDAEVETTLTDRERRSRRTVATVRLSADEPARMRVR